MRSRSPLATTYRAFQALTQRGKGGVYKAFDLSAWPPRLCILKEGRALGEIGWDGRDGSWLVRQEEAALSSLRRAGVAAPGVYSSFEVEGNYYLVTEYIEGETLQSLLNRRRGRLGLRAAYRYGARLATLITGIHAAGWAWWDCKPSNLVVTRGGELRPLDFEGACPLEEPDASPWSTTAFTPPPSTGAARSGADADLYALGVTIYLLLTGRLPAAGATEPVRALRRGVPPGVCRVVSGLLDADPRKRPDASTIAAEMTSTLSALKA
jgi:serine/threonine protein kinase